MAATAGVCGIASMVAPDLWRLPVASLSISAVVSLFVELEPREATPHCVQVNGVASDATHCFGPPIKIRELSGDV